MTHSKSSHSFSLSSLAPFLLITFGLTWGIIALYVFLPSQMASVFGELTGQHPLFYLAVYAPAIAALTIVVYRTGRSGLRRYLSRLLLWRTSTAWYAFLLVGVPLLFYAGAVWKGLSGAELIPVSSLGAYLGGPRAARD